MVKLQGSSHKSFATPEFLSCDGSTKLVLCGKGRPKVLLSADLSKHCSAAEELGTQPQEKVDDKLKS